MKKWCRVKILLLICIMGIYVVKGHVLTLQRLFR